MFQLHQINKTTLQQNVYWKNFLSAFRNNARNCDI